MAEPMTKPGKRILVVDDAAETCAMLFDLLSSDGYEVATASTGFQALEIVSRTRPDLVVCDLCMPGLDGMQVLGKMKQAHPGVKLLFLTAYGSRPRYIEALERGAIDMIQKPCPNEDLLRTVRRALEEAEKAPA